MMVAIKTTSVRDKEEEDEDLFMVSRLGKSGTGNDDDYDDDNDDDDGDEDEDRQEASHAQLLSDMMKLTKKKKMQQEVRTSLSSSTTVDTSHLLSRLGPSTGMKKDRHTHTLPLPVEKTVARRIKRAAGYENVAMEANKWAKLVKVRREADQLKFPLERNDLSLKTVEKTDLVQMRTPLEREVYSLLQGAKLIPEKKETEQEEMARKALSLQEIRERNKELWRQKEMKRRYEQKARLMNKSKSRKYHRLLRRERLRKQRAELEELHKTDPEAALERLQELEAARIEERMSLRHKTSKWAHLQGFRANRDKNAMAALRENQRMHEQLTAKTDKPQESEGEEEQPDDAGDTLKNEEVAAAVRGMEESQNPWLRHLHRSQIPKETEEDASFTKFKKFWEEVNRRKQADKEIEEQMEREKERKDLEDAEVEEKNDSEDYKEEEEEEEEEQEEQDKNKNKKKRKKDVQKETHEEEEEEEEEEKEDCNKNSNNKNNKNKNKKKRKKGEQTQTQDKEEESSKGGKEKLQKSKEKLQDVTEPEGDGEENKKNKSKKKKRKNKKQTEVLETSEQEALSIDKLFDEVETGIKNKVMKKLKKLGVDTKEPWKEVKSKKKKTNTTTTDKIAAEIEEFDFTSTRDQENTDERMGRAKTLQDLESIEGKSEDKLEKAVKVLKNSSATTTSGTGTPNKRKLQVDPNNFLQVEAKKLVTGLPDGVGEAGEALDDEEGNEETAEDIIREAFADDYLMEEFSTEKSEAIKKDQVGMSLAMPGWGDWTGPNIKMSNTKIKKFRLRIPQAPRKDSQLGNVLYNESADVHSKLRKAMVTELPYPFKSVKDFEASVRAPVGHQFMPVSAHKRLTAPPIVTKIGTVIQPMTEEELLRHHETTKGSRDDRQSAPSRGRKRKNKTTPGPNNTNKKVKQKV